MSSRILVTGFALVLAGLAGHSALGQDRDTAAAGQARGG